MSSFSLAGSLLLLRRLERRSTFSMKKERNLLKHLILLPPILRGGTLWLRNIGIRNKGRNRKIGRSCSSSFSCWRRSFDSWRKRSRLICGRAHFSSSLCQGLMIGRLIFFRGFWCQSKPRLKPWRSSSFTIDRRTKQASILNCKRKIDSGLFLSPDRYFNWDWWATFLTWKGFFLSLLPVGKAAS